MKEDTGVCGLDELLDDADGCGGADGAEEAQEEDELLVDMGNLLSGIVSDLSHRRSCRVFFNNICPDNFSSVISPVTRSMIRTHSL